MRFMTLVVALTFGTASIATAHAQSKMAVGVEAGVLHALDESLFQLGLRVTPSRGGYGSVDFAFATLPDALSNGSLVFLMDLGITYGAPGDGSPSPVYVFPHAGVSLFTAGSLSGSGGGGAVAGYNAGAGLLLSASPSLGFSFDYTYRRFTSGEVPASSITIGLMFRH